MLLLPESVLPKCPSESTIELQTIAVSFFIKLLKVNTRFYTLLDFDVLNVDAGSSKVVK